MIRALAFLTLPVVLAGCDRTDSAPAVTAAPVDTTAGALSSEPQGTVVIVSVAGVEPGGEPVDAVLQTQADWGTENATYRAQVPAEADAVALRFDGVAPGRYGVVAVQPVVPPIQIAPRRPVAGEETPPPRRALPPRPAPLAPKSPGGWGVAGADGRTQPEWTAVTVPVGSDGATVLVTLTGR